MSMSLSEKQIKKLESEDKPRIFIESGLGDAPIFFTLKGTKKLIVGIDNSAKCISIANKHHKQFPLKNIILFKKDSTDGLDDVFQLIKVSYLPSAEQNKERDKRPFNIVIFLDSHCIPVFDKSDKIVGWKQNGDSPILKELEIISNFINFIDNRTNQFPITITTYIDDLRVFKNPENHDKLYGEITYNMLESFVQNNLNKCLYSFVDSLNAKQDILKLIYHKPHNTGDNHGN